MLGYVFNPVSFWFCQRRDGSLRAIVCEVNNTFGERHCYLLDHGRTLHWGELLSAKKIFHVSPFCAVNGATSCGDSVLALAASEGDPYDGTSPHPEILEERARALLHLARGTVPIVVSTLRGALERTPAPESVLDLAVEFESLCEQYWRALQIGRPVLLSDAEMEVVLEKFRTYGQQR